ncbi:GGDEF domain-containing protein [Halioxenophilus aromaticivorans]|uniref:diguanylate cyclase n=1 Tax=Halioxenophilus aromaticivorans TaxID=1306992 RepID=A0AAV3U5J0_9ALTE
MTHRHTVQQANVISAKSIEFLGKYEIPAMPTNFAVAYELMLGKNDPLLSSVRDLADKDMLDAFRFQELYSTFIDKRPDINEQMINPIAHLLGTMMTACAQSSKTVDRYQRQLNEGGDALEEQAADPQEIIKALAQATQQVRDEQTQMNARLTEAEKEVKTLRTNLEQLEIEAITDPLSELSNRKGLERVLEDNPICAEHNCLGLFDIDHFKKINDNYGHNFGDYVIKQVAREIKNHIRGSDIAVRWGGEEFLLILRDTDLKGAVFVGNKIREAIRALRWKNTRTGEQLPPVTISGGVTQMDPTNLLLKDLDATVERADQSLYRAKQSGRNLICA